MSDQISHPLISEERKVEQDGTDGQNVERDVVDTSMEDICSPSLADSAASKYSRMSPVNLYLHSPSHIIGTPFTINAPPFEYPFPETSASPAVSEAFPTSTSLPPYSIAVSPPLSGFPSIGQSQLSLYSVQQKNPSCPLAHPKLHLGEQPPVPPSLAEKRRRWSIGIRGDSHESQTNERSTRSGRPTMSSDLALELASGCSAATVVNPELKTASPADTTLHNRESVPDRSKCDDNDEEL